MGPISLAQHAADGEEFLAALAANGLSVQTGKFLKRIRDGLLGRGHGGGWVAMSTARRLRHDLIDHSEPHHVIGGDL